MEQEKKNLNELSTVSSTSETSTKSDSKIDKDTVTIKKSINAETEKKVNNNEESKSLVKESETSIKQKSINPIVTDLKGKSTDENSNQTLKSSVQTTKLTSESLFKSTNETLTQLVKSLECKKTSSSPAISMSKPEITSTSEPSNANINVSSNLLKLPNTENKDKETTKKVPNTINLTVATTQSKTSSANLSNIKTTSTSSVTEAVKAVTIVVSENKLINDNVLSKTNISNALETEKISNIPKTTTDLNNAKPISLFSLNAEDTKKINDQQDNTSTIAISTKIASSDSKSITKTPAQIAAEGLISSLTKADGGITLPLINNKNKSTIGSPIVKPPIISDTKKLATNLIKNIQLEQKTNQLFAKTSISKSSLNNINNITTTSGSLDKKEIQAAAAAAVASAAAALTPTLTRSKSQETSANVAAVVAAAFNKANAAVVAQQKIVPQSSQTKAHTSKIQNKSQTPIQFQNLQQQLKSALPTTTQPTTSTPTAVSKIDQVKKAILSTQQTQQPIATSKLTTPGTPSTNTATTKNDTKTTPVQSAAATPTIKVVTPITNPNVAAAIAKSMNNAALNQQLIGTKAEPTVISPNSTTSSANLISNLQKNNISPVAANNLGLNINPTLANLKAKFNLNNYPIKNGIPKNMNVAAAVAANPQALQAAIASSQFSKNYYNLAQLNALREKQKLQQQNFYISQQQLQQLQQQRAAALSNVGLNILNNPVLNGANQATLLNTGLMGLNANNTAKINANPTAVAASSSAINPSMIKKDFNMNLLLQKQQLQKFEQAAVAAAAQQATQQAVQQQKISQAQVHTQAQIQAKVIQAQALAQAQSQVANSTLSNQALQQQQLQKQTIDNSISTAKTSSTLTTSTPTTTITTTSVTANTKAASLSTTVEFPIQNQTQASSTSNPIQTITSTITTTVVTPNTVSNTTTSATSNTIPVIKIEDAKNSTIAINNSQLPIKQHIDKNPSPITVAFDSRTVKNEIEERRKRELASLNDTISREKRKIVKLKVNKKPKLKISEEDELDPESDIFQVVNGIASIVPTYNYKEYKNMGKVSKWIWTPFGSSARDDNLQLFHWRKASEDSDDYEFAKFNKCVDIQDYTDEEYNTYLSDPAWTKEETAYLMDLCKQFDLRFYVIFDRYEYPHHKRTMEDLKDRYYQLTKKILNIRSKKDSKLKEQLEYYNYDKNKEIERKKHLQSLYNRTKEQIEEEDVLFLELRRRRLKESEWLKERDNLLQLLNINNVINSTVVNKKKRNIHQTDQYENTPTINNTALQKTNPSPTQNSANNVTTNNLVSSPKSIPTAVATGTSTGTPKPTSHHTNSARSVNNSPSNSHSSSLHKSNSHSVNNVSTVSISVSHEKSSSKPHHHTKTSNEDSEVSSVKKERLPSGVYLRSSRVLNMKNSIIPRVNHYFEENEIPYYPSMPTQSTCAAYNELRSQVVTLMELKRKNEHLEKELKNPNYRKMSNTSELSSTVVSSSSTKSTKVKKRSLSPTTVKEPKKGRFMKTYQ